MESENPLAVVRDWQEAANKQDLEQLLELSDPHIEIIGPRGSGYGHQLLRDWLGRAGVSLTTRRAFVKGEVVVLAQHGLWRSVVTGEVTGEQDIAARFRVNGRRVVQFARYDSLETTLQEAGLDYSHEVVEN